MTETGRVREIKGDFIVIQPEKGIACFGCMNMECKTEGSITAENPRALPLNTGQTVQVRAPLLSLLGQASAALLPPALGFSASFFLTRLLFPAAGEGAAAGLGVAFLFATAFVIYMIRKKFPAKRVYTVTKIIG